MKRFLAMTAAIAALIALAATPVKAKLEYYPDPVYKKLHPEDESPMADVIALAEKGDVRAQFIMGDLYSKGKGGLPKDTKEARRWFEAAAVHGYAYSFLRLAALSRREGNLAEAWQWYTLAINSLDRGDAQKFAAKARADLVEEAPLSQEQLAEARKAVTAWNDMKDARLKEEAKAKTAQETPGAEETENSPLVQTMTKGVKYNE